MTQRVAIVGAGLMGAGLALVFAGGGHQVKITDVAPQSLGTVKTRVADLLSSLGMASEAVDHITPVARLAEAISEADIVVEAAPENLELKQQLFADIEAVAPEQAILASNTSVIPIGKVMAKVKRKQRALGTHWWNPPYLVPLVEVIQTAETDAAIVQQMMELLISLGKVPVHVKKDVPGFVGNRLQHALWREAISLVEQGVCDAETVDLVVTSSFGRRLAVLGPLANADMVGTDLTQSIQNYLLPDLNRDTGPTDLLNAMVAEKRLGFKTDQGFFHWTEDQKAALRTKVADHLKTLDEILGRT